jgi:hypothetical protein
LTKYEELCAAYAGPRKQFSENRDACLRIAEQLHASLVEHLGCDPRHVRFTRFNVTGDTRKDYSLNDVLRNTSGANWAFALGLTLSEQPDTPPTETVLIGISIEQTTGGHNIHVKGMSDRFRLAASADNSRALQSFSEAVYRRVRDSYKKASLRFGLEEHSERELGQ